MSDTLERPPEPQSVSELREWAQQTLDEGSSDPWCQLARKVLDLFRWVDQVIDSTGGAER